MSILSDRLLKECLERVARLEARLDALLATMEAPHHARMLIADESLLEQTNMAHFGDGVREVIPAVKRARGRPRKNAYG